MHVKCPHSLVLAVNRRLLVISQLADLFWQLEYCSTTAVTPTIELAKLALVTSRDEEEDEADKGGTDSSNDTDATLVDDGPSRILASDQILQPPGSPGLSLGSVLGKRPRDVERQRSEMDVDSPVESKDAFVAVQTFRLSNSPPLVSEPSPSQVPDVPMSSDDKDVDVEMQTQDGLPVDDQPVQKPTLPPKKATQISDSTMMFGRLLSSVSGVLN
jgi:ubiquitin carboxyl-terminal hydrolase 25/28